MKTEELKSGYIVATMVHGDINILDTLKMNFAEENILNKHHQ